MHTKSYLFDPTVSFDYVSDHLLWDAVFQSPIPKDIENPNNGKVNLSKYFNVEEYFLEEDCLNGYYKLISAKRIFFTVSEKERITAFVALCGFLERFRKPFIECYISIPKHPDVEYNEKFNPVLIKFSEPMYFSLNGGNRIVMNLNEETFDKFHKYSFGFDVSEFEKGSYQKFTLCYSFCCFCGIILCS